MKSLLRKLFIDNWQRKIIALILAMITWILVNHSLRTSKTVNNIPVKIVNMPQGKTVEGIKSNNILNETISLSITGNRLILQTLSSNDFQIVIDALNQEEEWTTFITKKNLISVNPNINIERSIKTVTPQKFHIKLSKFVSERIPILITPPIGEAPKGYHFLDLWPYQLYATVSGSEDLIKKIKTTGQKLTFNLNAISKKELDTLSSSTVRGNKDVVSFFVPTIWKMVKISSISSSPIEIDDPDANALRIDFIKKDYIPINASIPVHLFFPLQNSDSLNPEIVTLENNSLIINENNINVINTPMYAQGISELFLDIVKNNIHLVILVESNDNNQQLQWNIQPIIPLELEELYIQRITNESLDEDSNELDPPLREAYLRNRFRMYMNKFRLWLSTEQKLHLNIQLMDNKVKVNLRK